jgi:GGDEF domain-containing protein
MSLRSFDPSAVAVPQAAEQTTALTRLIDGIAEYSVDIDPDENNNFREKLAAESARIKEIEDRAATESVVTSVLELMCTHRDTLQTAHEKYSSELKKAMRMMTDTIAHIGKSSQVAVHQLSVIEKKLEEASAIRDAANLQMKLAVCLQMIREQSEALQAQSQAQINQVKTFLNTAGLSEAEGLLESSVDPLTGLPARPFAEKLIQDQLNSKTRGLIGLFVVNRLAGIEGKYGRRASEDVVRVVARHLAQKLPVSSTLCVWSANSFVTITDAGSGQADAAYQLRRLGGMQLEKSIEGQARSAFLLLTTSFLSLELGPQASKRGLTQEMDAFAAQHGPR